MASSLNKINKILKRTVPQLESKDIIEIIDEEEIIEVFISLEKILKKAFEKNEKEAAFIVASLHYNLFERAVYNNNEKARLSLLFLKSKFRKIADFSKYGLGHFLYNYSKMWFKFFVSLEGKARLYISWLDSTEKLTMGKKFDEIIDNFDKSLPELHPESIFDDLYNEETKNKLESLVYKKNTTDIGIEYQKWIYSLMYQHIMEDDETAFKELFLVLFQFPDDDLLAFDEILHEYAKNWYRHSLRLKKWFLNFSKNLSQEPYLVERMWRGMFWSQMKGKPLREIVNDWRNTNIEKNVQEILNV